MKTNSPECWRFQPANGGQISGVNNAALETFAGSPIKALVRETLQNSLDAKSSKNNGPVRVEFERFDVPAAEVPGQDELMAAVKGCILTGAQFGSNKQVSVFTTALNELRGDSVRMLRVSDYGTTGLTGSDRGYGYPFSLLTNETGSSVKSDVAGGSYGIGKGAAQYVSRARTVYYSTMDENGLEASRGVAQLASFQDPVIGMTTGPGVYDRGNADPIESQLTFPGRPKRGRNEPGTDVYVLGPDINDGTYEWECARYVVADFIMAIMLGNLVVSIGSGDGAIVIDRDSLGGDDGVISRLAADLRDPAATKTASDDDIAAWRRAVSEYELLHALGVGDGQTRELVEDGVTTYRAIPYEPGVNPFTAEGMEAARDAYDKRLATPSLKPLLKPTGKLTKNLKTGDMTLYLATSTGSRGFDRQIAKMRAPGMYLFGSSHNLSGIDFTGILHVTGDALNRWLRSMESPRHDEWSAKRVSDAQGGELNSTNAQAILEFVNYWVRAQIRAAVFSGRSSEMGVVGLDGFTLENDDVEIAETGTDKPKPKKRRATLPRKGDLELAVVPDIITGGGTGRNDGETGDQRNQKPGNPRKKTPANGVNNPILRNAGPDGRYTYSFTAAPGMGKAPVKLSVLAYGEEDRKPTGACIEDASVHGASGSILQPSLIGYGLGKQGEEIIIGNVNAGETITVSFRTSIPMTMPLDVEVH